MFNSFFERFVIFVVFIALLSNIFFRLKNKKVRYYCFSALFSFCFFCGFGALNPSVKFDYFLYFSAYLCFFFLPVFFFCRKSSSIQMTDSGDDYSEFLISFIESKGILIVIIYYTFCLLEIFLSGRFFALFSGIQIDVSTQFMNRMNNISRGTLFVFVDYLKTLVFPFFLLSLYKFRNHIIKMCILYLIPCYLDFCLNSYMGRSTLFGHVFIIFFLIYIFCKKARKALLIVSPVLILFMLFFSAYFYNIRSYGDTTMFENLVLEASLSESFQNCIELSAYQNHSDFFEYLLNLPLPSFLKFTDIDPQFSVIYSEYTLMLDRTNPGFYVMLPAVVNESIFLLGEKLFFLHALISGGLFALAVRWMLNPSKIVIYLYLLCLIFPAFARAGCVLGYPFIVKQYFLLELVLYIMYCSYRNKSQKHEAVCEPV